MGHGLFAAGSNASAQLSLGHAKDVHTFTECLFHSSIEHLLPNSSIIDLVSASTHALLLLQVNQAGVTRNIALGAGANTLGQLGPRCALWDEVKPEARWKPVDLLGPIGESNDQWEPVKIAVTWTTSFVMYRRLLITASKSGSSGAESEEDCPEEMLVSCGSNDFGELGRSPSREEGHVPITTPSAKPCIVEIGLQIGERVEMIKGGQRHVLAVVGQKDGSQRIMGWGSARKGQLSGDTIEEHGNASGAGGSSERISQGSMGKGKGKSKAAGFATSSLPVTIQLPISSNSRVKDIALGSIHSVALLDDGSVLGWGGNTKGQIQGLSAASRVQSIAATWSGTYCLERKGSHLILRSYGSTQYGDTSEEDTQRNSRKLRLSDTAENCRLIAGSEHLAILSTLDGQDSLLLGGWNEHGNLGFGDTENRESMVPLDLSQFGRDRGQIVGLWGGCAATWICFER